METKDYDVTLYTTHCPKCKVLEKKLEEIGIDYNLIEDEDIMMEKGFMAAPMLEVDGKVMGFSDAVKWVNKLI